MDKVKSLQAQWSSAPSICQIPVRLPGIQTLVAENRFSVLLICFKPAPITSCEDEYMGEESIMPPPRSKKACITRNTFSRLLRTAPASKVSQLPRPITGISTPVDGTTRLMMPCGFSDASRGESTQRLLSPATPPINDLRRIPLSMKLILTRFGFPGSPKWSTGAINALN